MREIAESVFCATNRVAAPMQRRTIAPASAGLHILIAIDEFRRELIIDGTAMVSSDHVCRPQHSNAKPLNSAFTAQALRVKGVCPGIAETFVTWSVPELSFVRRTHTPRASVAP